MLCYVASGNATRIAVGDAMKLTGTGGPTLPTGMSPGTRQVPGVTPATAGDTIYGVVVDIRRNNAQLYDTGLPASTEGRVVLEVDPLVVYKCQTDGTALAVANIGLNFDLTTTESTLSNGISVSNHVVDVSGGGGTGTAQVRLQGYYTDPNNSSVEIALVTIVESRFSTATGV